MTVDEIFGRVAQHMIKGTMVHEQFANYYDFLGLEGYQRMHEYHYLDETCAYRRLCRYFIEHHNRLVPKMSFENPDVIPDDWHKYKRQDVDRETKAVALRNGMQRWVDWEKETKRLYQDMYKELADMGEAASAAMVAELVSDVDEELKTVERFALEKAAMDYDMTQIAAEQADVCDMYEKKLKEVCLC